MMILDVYDCICIDWMSQIMSQASEPSQLSEPSLRGPSNESRVSRPGGGAADPRELGSRSGVRSPMATRTEDEGTLQRVYYDDVSVSYQCH